MNIIEGFNSLRLKELIQKLFFIGVGQIIPKALFFLIPFVLTSVKYQQFNKGYYLLSLVTLISGFGFEFSLQRCNISKNKLFLFLLLNSTIISTVFMAGGLFAGHFLSLPIIILVSVLFNIINVLVFVFLFKRKYKFYTIIQVLFYGILYILFFSVQDFFENPFYAYGLIAIVAFFLTYPVFYLKIGFSYSKTDFIDLYKLGFSALLINGLFTIILSINHLIAANLFPASVSNSLVFAWLILIPVQYVSNIFEKIFYSSNKLKNKLNYWVFIEFIIMLLYFLSLILLLTYFGFLIPVSVNKSLLFGYSIKIFPFIIFYAVGNSFLNAILFKYKKSKVQRFLSTVYLFGIVMFLSLSFAALNGYVKFQIENLIAFTNISIMLIILIKWFAVKMKK